VKRRGEFFRGVPPTRFDGRMFAFLAVSNLHCRLPVRSKGFGHAGGIHHFSDENHRLFNRDN
jgi:hypothetical protein